jgi:hypothetical protein
MKNNPLTSFLDILEALATLLELLGAIAGI